MQLSQATLDSNVEDPVLFPPGTVLLHEEVELHRTAGLAYAANGHTVLQPQPPSNPNHPLNWTLYRKYINFALACLYTLFVYSILDISTVSWAVLNAELGYSYSLLSDSFATNTAALAIGCIILVPLTVKYGRRPMYLATTLAITFSAVGTALQRNGATLIGMNFLSGFAGSVGDCLVQMTIADLFFTHERGFMNGIYIVMVSFGGFGAPLAAGYIIVDQGWRWTFWYCVIFTGVLFFAILFLYEETQCEGVVINATSRLVETRPTKARQSVEHERKISESKLQPTVSVDVEGSGGKSPEFDKPYFWIDRSIPLKSFKQNLTWFTKTPGTFKDFVRLTTEPFIYLYRFPACTFTALQYGAVLCWFSAIGNTEALFLSGPPYHFNASGIGLVTVPALIGALLGSVYGGPVSDKFIMWLTRRHNGIYEPEMRLWLAVPLIIVAPTGLLMYGVGAVQGLPWIVPFLGVGLFGFALSASSTISLVYLIDSYADVIGPCLVGVSIIRNGLATILVFVFNPWVQGIGYQNVFIMCACLAAGVNLTVLPMMYFGKKLRTYTAPRYKEYAMLHATS